ncbi:DEAD/DEAH box helicase [Haloferula sargassicola]|uniref:Helicase n=1 Tax=Haloferula sargassicola TaxID=490096 RepID=A0ABP9UIB2_9BACT
MSLSLPAPIQHWIAAKGWRDSFDLKAIRRGLGYADSPRISKLSVSPAGDSEILIQASVKGTARTPYQVEIEIYTIGSELHGSSECSCPVGSQCKHGAAILEYLSKQKASASEKQAPAPKLPSEVSNWLRLLEVESGNVHRNPATNYDFLAYCIEPPSIYDSSRSPVLELRKASESPRNGLRVTNTRARADASSPAAYFAPEDIPLVAIYQAFAKNSYQTPQLRGAAWTSLLANALERGRLFFGSAETAYIPLTAGPARKVSPVWSETPDGDARPALAFDGDSQSGLIFVPTEPPAYVDPRHGLFGRLESELPAATLERWQNGPLISANSLSLVETAAAPLASAGLPSPISRPTEQLPRVGPTPHLRLVNANIGPRYRPFKSIIGRLRFTYHHSPELKPLTNKQNPETGWVCDGVRYVTVRDLKTERRLEKSLKSCGLESLRALFGSYEVTQEHQRDVTVAEPFPSIEDAWFGFLNDYAEDLRSKGWTITIDPATGLIIHDVSSFVPALEAETDHGIDWFRFDLHGELGGEKISLIPYIAEAIHRGLPDLDSIELPEFLVFPHENPEKGFVRLPARPFLELCHHVAHLFQGHSGSPPRLDRLAAAGIAHTLKIDDSETTRALADFGRKLSDIRGLPAIAPPAKLQAELRPYQLEGYRWLRFLADHRLHGILADDMGLGKTVQTLAFIAGTLPPRKERKPSLVIAPTSVITNWAAEAARFTPDLRTLLLHGPERKGRFDQIPTADLVLTSYPLLIRDHETLVAQDWHALILDEAQSIKNPRTALAKSACSLKADHRFCLSGTPMENHLGELWSLMRFLMPGFLGDNDTFRETYRRPIERDRSPQAQLALNRRVAPLILRRTKDQVATDLPAKTEVVHHLDLSPREADLYEGVRALMDKRVRAAIAEQGLGRSHIIVLDALLKLRQVCCHPALLKTPEAAKIKDATKLAFLTTDLLPTLLEENRRILLFSQFTTMLDRIAAHLEKRKVPFLQLTGQTKNRAELVKRFQTGEVPVFLISLKAGGTGLNLTAADTVIHYDPWWNPAAENQATDRAHRIGQTKPVFVHKLICRGTIEDRILDLQKHKARLVESLLSEETTALKLDSETLSQLLAPLG